MLGCFLGIPSLGMPKRLFRRSAPDYRLPTPNENKGNASIKGELGPEDPTDEGKDGEEYKQRNRKI